MLDESQRERLRDLTVEALLDLRALYLATPQANALKHWELLLTRMRASARVSASPEEWWTHMTRRLQIGSPSSSASKTCFELAARVRELSAASEWLDLIEREHGYLMAKARLISEQRREARQQS